MDMPWNLPNAVTPAEVLRRRKLADALKNDGFQAVNPLGALAKGLSGAVSGFEAKTAADLEGKGQAGFNARLAEALSGGADIGQLAELAGDPWMSNGQGAIVNALVGKELTPEPAYQPNFTTFNDPVTGDIMRYDQNDPNAQPSLFYDVPDATAAPDIKGESTLRSEYGGTNTVKDFALQTQAYQRVLDSANNPSPAGDMALLYAYMKMLDPGSVVRETEFATAAASGSFGERIKASVDQILSGTRLTDVQRRDFLDRAGQIFSGAADLQSETNNRYTQLAEQYGYDPSRIVSPLPAIGVLDPNFNVAEYLNTQTGEQIKPIPVTNDAEYQAIPKGVQYVDPEGNVRIKQ